MRTILPAAARLPDFVTERLEARIACLRAEGGPLDQAQAIIGLARAIADGVADELTRRLPFRMLYVPQPIPAPVLVRPAIQVVPAADSYDAMTVVALKDEARRCGLPVRPRVKKVELIEALRSL